MDEKQKVYDFLDSHNIKYEAFNHAAAYTIEDIDKMGIFNKGVGCKNLFLRDEKGRRHFLLIAPEHKKINLKEVRHKIGSTRLSFGSEERLWNCLKLTPGSVSPFGVLNDSECKVEVVFDKDLENENCLGFHPNDNTATVWISFKDIKSVIEENGNSIMLIEI